MSAIASRNDIAALLGPREEIAADCYATPIAFEREDALEVNKRKKGRLGRLTYEFKTADVLNQNRRIYPKGVVELAHVGFRERVSNNVVFGELDHPAWWSEEALSVNLSEACIKVSECTLSGTDVKVVVDVLDNDLGKQLMSVLEAGGNPGISQRAVARWREPTPEERAVYKVPEGEFVRVAEFLRLITYDIVSEPGFADATGAKVTESKHEGAGPMDRETLKKNHPALFEQIFNEGRTAGLLELEAKVATAVEAAKPKHVEEAVKPLNEQIVKLTTTNAAVVKALESIKPVMTELKLVNETLTDAEAGRKIGALETTNADLQAKLTAAQAEIKSANEKVAATAAKASMEAGLIAVNEAYKTHAHRERILVAVAKRNPADSATALAYAKEAAELLEGVAGTIGNPPSPQGLTVLENLGLVKAPSQNPGTGGGGGGGLPANEAAQAAGIQGLRAGGGFGNMSI